MKALIVGLGRMGLFMARLVEQLGYSVEGYDADPSKRESARKMGLKVCESVNERLDHDLVIAAVSLTASPGLARALLPRMKPGSRYLDISSVKKPVNDAIRSVSSTGILVVSVHPLFGPGARSIKGKTVILTPIKDVNQELEVARTMFKEARLTIMSEEEHDKAVAYSIILPQIVGYVYRGLTAKTSVLPTTSAKLQSVAAAVEADSPGLAAELLCANKYSENVLRSIESIVADLLGLLKSSACDELRRKLELLRGEWREWEALYSLAYDALDLLVRERLN